MSACISLARRASSHPSIPGMRMSVITRDRRGSRSIRSRPYAPFCAVMTSYPRSSSSSSRRTRIPSSSSTTISIQRKLQS